MKNLIIVLAILFASCSASSDDECVGTREEINIKYARLIAMAVAGNDSNLESLQKEYEIALQNACD